MFGVTYLPINGGLFKKTFALNDGDRRTSEAFMVKTTSVEENIVKK